MYNYMVINVFTNISELPLYIKVSISQELNTIFLYTPCSVNVILHRIITHEML